VGDETLGIVTTRCCTTVGGGGCWEVVVGRRCTLNQSDYP